MTTRRSLNFRMKTTVVKQVRIGGHFLLQMLIIFPDIYEQIEDMCDLGLTDPDSHRYINVTFAVCKTLCSIVHNLECSGILYNISASTCSITASNVLLVPPGLCDAHPAYFRRHRNLSELAAGSERKLTKVIKWKLLDIIRNWVSLLRL
jgi:hypothetical protein